MSRSSLYAVVHCALAELSLLNFRALIEFINKTLHNELMLRLSVKSGWVGALPHVGY